MRFQAKIALLFTMIFLLIMVSQETAQNRPQMINYSDQMTNPGVNPDGNSNYSVVFTIYDNSVGDIA